LRPPVQNFLLQLVSIEAADVAGWLYRRGAGHAMRGPPEFAKIVVLLLPEIVHLDAKEIF
jgi:hypothetical protein